MRRAILSISCEIAFRWMPQDYWWLVNFGLGNGLVPSGQGWQVLASLGKNRLKTPVKTVRKKQVLDSQYGQNWSKL